MDKRLATVSVDVVANFMRITSCMAIAYWIHAICQNVVTKIQKKYSIDSFF